MPPYSSSSNILDEHTYIDPFVDAPLGSTVKQQQQQQQPVHPEGAAVTTSQGTKEEVIEGDDSERRSPSVFDKLLDFNPCMNMGKPSFTMPNPASAVFKSRVCSECGNKCTKLQGYKKEKTEMTVLVVVDEETGEENEVKETTKIYYHKWCSQIKEYREEHKQNGAYETVMRNLLDYFRALELEAQMKREAEIRRKAQEEEALRITIAAEVEKAAKADAAAELELKARSAPLNKMSSVGKKASSRLMKSMKKSFSIKKSKKDRSTTSAHKKESSKKVPSVQKSSSSSSSRS